MSQTARRKHQLPGRSHTCPPSMSSRRKRGSWPLVIQIGGKNNTMIVNLSLTGNVTSTNSLEVVHNSSLERASKKPVNSVSTKPSPLSPSPYKLGSIAETGNYDGDQLVPSRKGGTRDNDMSYAHKNTHEEQAKEVSYCRSQDEDSDLETLSSEIPFGLETDQDLSRLVRLVSEDYSSSFTGSNSRDLPPDSLESDSPHNTNNSSGGGKNDSDNSGGQGGSGGGGGLAGGHGGRSGGDGDEEGDGEDRKPPKDGSDDTDSSDEDKVTSSRSPIGDSSVTDGTQHLDAAPANKLLGGQPEDVGESGDDQPSSEAMPVNAANSQSSSRDNDQYAVSEADRQLANGQLLEVHPVLRSIILINIIETLLSPTLWGESGDLMLRTDLQVLRHLLIAGDNRQFWWRLLNWRNERQPPALQWGQSQAIAEEADDGQPPSRAITAHDQQTPEDNTENGPALNLSASSRADRQPETAQVLGIPHGVLALVWNFILETLASRSLRRRPTHCLALPSSIQQQRQERGSQSELRRLLCLPQRRQVTVNRKPQTWTKITRRSFHRERPRSVSRRRRWKCHRRDPPLPTLGAGLSFLAGIRDQHDELVQPAGASDQTSQGEDHQPAGTDAGSTRSLNPGINLRSFNTVLAQPDDDLEEEIDDEANMNDSDDEINAVSLGRSPLLQARNDHVVVEQAHAQEERQNQQASMQQGPVDHGDELAAEGAMGDNQLEQGATGFTLPGIFALKPREDNCEVCLLPVPQEYVCGCGLALCRECYIQSRHLAPAPDPSAASSRPRCPWCMRPRKD